MAREPLDTRVQPLGAAPDHSQGSGRRVLMLLQNQTLPRDARVWPECLTLRDAGFEVVAICPASDRYPERYCRIDGVEIHRFPLRAASGGALGYLREYAQTMWQMARTVRRVARGRHFDVVHAANPPDLLSHNLRPRMPEFEELREIPLAFHHLSRNRAVNRDLRPAIFFRMRS